MSETPTFMRYRRVQIVLEKEPALSRQLSPKTEFVFKGNGSGEKQAFSPEVVQVTNSIHAAGLDAQTLSHQEIIKRAVNEVLLKRTSKATSPKLPDPNLDKPAPRVQAKSETFDPPARALKKKEIPQPAPASEPAPKTRQNRSNPDETQAETTPIADPAPENEEPVPRASASPATVSQEKKTTTLPGKSEQSAEPSSAAAILARIPGGNLPYCPGVSIVSLFANILQLVEHYDKEPGAAERLKQLEQLTATYKRLTIIPRAKETQSAGVAS